MKKSIILIFSLVISIVFQSCYIRATDNKQRDISNIKIISEGCYFNTLEYNNHSYIIYSQNYGNTISIVHNPDCKCNMISK